MISMSPVLKAPAGPISWSLPSHFGGSAVSRPR